MSKTAFQKKMENFTPQELSFMTEMIEEASIQDIEYETIKIDSKPFCAFFVIMTISLFIGVGTIYLSQALAP